MEIIQKIRTRIHFGVYISVIVIGVALTFLSFLNSSTSSDIEKNVYSVLCNLGAGVLASGIIGWFFDVMNARINEDIIVYKRAFILGDLKSGLQTFLNESGNKYFEFNRLAYNKTIEPREIAVCDIFGKVKECEKTFLNQYGNNQLDTEYLRPYVRKVYGENSSFFPLGEIAEKILCDRESYIIGGILLREEVDLIDTIRVCAENIKGLADRDEYVSAIAYVDLFYEKVRIIIASIRECSCFAEMRFVNYTVRNAVPCCDNSRY